MNRRRALFVLVAPALMAAAETDARKHKKNKRDRNCSDFSNQKKAQKFFEKRGGPRKDRHGLDADGDGIACEELD